METKAKKEAASRSFDRGRTEKAGCLLAGW